MKSGENPLGREDNIVIQELKDEILIYDLRKNKALCLNKTSALIWQECDGTKSVAEISRSLSKKLKLNISQDLVWLAVQQFKTDGLLADNQNFVTPFDGLNRREVIRRIGFASLVALPVISAIVAPTALQAQSGGNCGTVGGCSAVLASVCTCLAIAPVGINVNPNGCPCATNGDCSGDCLCDNPCTAPGGSNPCQSGTCITDSSQSNFGSCSGICPPGNNICVNGTVAPICIPGNGSNLNPDCCPCSNIEDCINSCNDGTCGPQIG